MSYFLAERVYKHQMTRRDFLWLTSVSTASFVSGCAVNPVTGKQQLMLMSESQEISIDKEQSPHQISTDYGTLQDQRLNNYISEVGNKMARRSHRPKMPYSFQGVNATYVNAYAFPGGTIATTRGILLALKNEAELAGLLGHEIGHVNARHTASRMSKNMLIGATVMLGTALISSSKKYRHFGQIAGLIGQVGSGMLLAHYSRTDERQADSLGMEYMVKSGNSPHGMVGLMELLKTMSKHKPSVVETMFATHPMGSERYNSAKASANGMYRRHRKMPLNRDRYMDNTAKLRRMKKSIEAMQQGEKEMGSKNFSRAERQFKKALNRTPNDYAALLMMTKCQIAREQPKQANRYISLAKRINPNEAQARNLSGVTNMMYSRFDVAYKDFVKSERLLPGNPNTVFLQGISLESMQDKRAAANAYSRFLKVNKRGDQAQHAKQRLKDWGYKH
ncbi:M48 family metalloprotease [Thiotrichales bacterium HSG1]|nr:M48 family metalloprotease [Thiotrichales bacterium HSG1]